MVTKEKNKVSFKAAVDKSSMSTTATCCKYLDLPRACCFQDV